MWLRGILCFGFNIQTTLSTGCDDCRLKCLDIPDQHSKGHSMIPLNWAASFIQELSAENIQQGIMGAI
jgi:hypothetical protein